METIQGFVEKIIYSNENNGYQVLSLETKDGDCVCVGYFTNVSEGEFIHLSGEWVNNPGYGIQFKMNTFEITRPTDSESVLKYLSSGVIKGIGQVMAKKIVDEFGADTFRILEEEPIKLAKIKGISNKMALDFGAQVREKKDSRAAMMFLLEYGISMVLANRIYKTYGMAVYGIIKENPYKLAQDVEGVGFKTADEIAKKVGITPDCVFRIESGIVYALLEESVSGNVCCPLEILKEKAAQLLELYEYEEFDTCISNLIVDKRIIVKNVMDTQMVYLPYFYFSEMEVAKRLVELDKAYEVDEEEFFRKLEYVERVTGIELEEYQKQAVLAALKNGVLVVTGGPGTGKTTTINAIIKMFELYGFEIRLAAPTGRAAKRMSEATKYDAKTIHRLLEISGMATEGNNIFGRDEDNPIEADVVVIDEMSMVDISLMRSLLKAIGPDTRLILVGDANQLPSVGPGNVLKDIIQSEAFEVVKLTRIFRQGEESDIVINAHKINEGNYVDLKKYSKDFLYVNRDAQSIFGAMITLIKSKLSGYVGVSPYEVSVLTPTRVGNLGSIKLNELLQEHLNPPEGKKKEKIYGEYIFREGDKVMQVKNNYQIPWEVKKKLYGFPLEQGMGIFNGDVGIIVQINTFSNEVTVEYEHDSTGQKYVTYKAEELSELELAYAITIHKSQGSEYPAVIIPLAPGPRRLMNRNLLYTAVTRAKQCVCMIGQSEVFYDMVENDKEQERYSTLSIRVREVVGEDITDGN